MKIMAATGASGGHVFPAIAFLDNVKELCPDAELILLAPERARPLLKEEMKGKNVIFVCDGAISLRKPRLLLGVLACCFQSVLNVLKYKPDIVAGFGSLSSVAAVVFSRLCGRKTMIHEQNVLPGKANMFLRSFADTIAVSFDKTGTCLGRYSHKAVYTGNPVRGALKRYSRKEACAFFGFSQDIFTLLVMGGSQGSVAINRAIQRYLEGYSGVKPLQLIHILGAKDSARIDTKALGPGISYKAFSFLENMDYAYCASDAAICRAGATTVSELVFYSLPAILVPYPYARRHQEANAQVLVHSGCASLLDEKSLSAQELKIRIDKFMSPPDGLSAMRSGYKKLNLPDSGRLLAESALRLCK